MIKKEPCLDNSEKELESRIQEDVQSSFNIDNSDLVYMKSSNIGSTVNEALGKVVYISRLFECAIANNKNPLEEIKMMKTCKNTKALWGQPLIMIYKPYKEY